MTVEDRWCLTQRVTRAPVWINPPLKVADEVCQKLPSAGASGHKLTFFLNETSYLWGRNKFELSCTHIWCFSNTYILNCDQTNWLFPCRRVSGELPYLKCPLHTVLKLTPVAYGQPLCSTFTSSPFNVLDRLQILFDCVCFFSSLLSQVVKWSLSSSTSKLSTRTETNQRWIMFHFYHVVSAELPVEPSRMKILQQFCYFKLLFPDYTHKPSLTICNIFTLTFFYLYFCALLEVWLIWVLPPSLVTTTGWSGVS